VEIGLKGPRISAGASGLGSKVSIWLGPPIKKSKIPLRSESIVEAVADNPMGAKAPNSMNVRRDQLPDWRLPRGVSIRIMVESPEDSLKYPATTVKHLHAECDS
jgi:hypothetical protein